MLLILVFFLCALIIIELLLRLVKLESLVDPTHRFKVSHNYLPAAHPPERFLFKITNHPWIKFESPIVITRNNLGFRGRELNKQKKKNEVRVFLIGDSFLADHFHSDSECLTHLVQELLSERFPQLDIIVNTTAFSAEVNNDHLATLVHQVASLEPDVILVTPELVNFEPGIKCQDVIVQSNKYQYSMKLCWRMLLSYFKLYQLYYHIRVKHWGSYITFNKEGHRVHHWNYGEVIRQTCTRSFLNGPLPAHNMNRALTLLNVFNGYCKEANCKLLVAHRATRRDKDEKAQHVENLEYFRGWSNAIRYRVPQHILAGAEERYWKDIEFMCKKKNIPTFDLQPLIPSTKMLWVDDTHLHNGISIAAENIAKEIANLL